jgi:hypothetical protein
MVYNRYTESAVVYPSSSKDLPVDNTVDPVQVAGTNQPLFWGFFVSEEFTSHLLNK